ncbi:MAG TPA: endonuclease/exonuclease/phosphatase family protein [Thermoleophilia bacterium]|nr:endonuclease/exonuclease/phosphatase family protein [Thermoleophilia bacterium]
MTGPGGETPALRVASFNIRNGIAWDGLDSWPLRRGATAAAVAGLDADLLGLQEVYGFQQRYLLRRLPDYAATGAGRTDGRRRGERCAVLYRTERLRLDQAITRWFSDTPDLPGSTGWGNRLPRIVTLARFTDLAVGRPFGFADCHLEGSPAAARHRSAAALAGWLDPSLPWIVAGDLNAEPHDLAVRTLLDAGLRDVVARAAAAPSDQASVTTVGEPRTGAAGRRIDYLLVTGEWQVVAAAVPAAGRHRRRPSDHLPVLATVRLRGGAALPTLGQTTTSDPLEEQR